MVPLAVPAFCTETAPVVWIAIMPPIVPRPLMRAPGASARVPDLSATLPEPMSSSPLPVMVTERVPKSSTQPLPITNCLVMLHGPVPLGHPLSLALICAAVAGSSRRLVCVDADPVACDFATLNAGSAAMADRVEVRALPLTLALAASEEFALVIADPPWVRRTETDRFPEDPLSAIDGGPDGLDVARLCVEVIGVHLMPDGAALLQVGSSEQVVELGADLELAGLVVVETGCYDGGVVVCLRRAW